MFSWKISPLLGSNSTVGYVLILTKGASALRIASVCLSTPAPSRARSGILLSLLLKMFVREILTRLHLSSVTFCWRSLTAVPFPPDEQLKVLSEKNKELEAAQDRNAAIQVLLGLDQELKSCGSPALYRMHSVPTGVYQDQYPYELVEMFACPWGVCARKLFK